jgi:prepilin-type N-terminal cleavage/methylation domain-containing protein
MKSINKNQKGFTVIELLIATTVFSVVLVVFMASFLKISQLFYKGVNISNTQASARNVVQDITNDIQFYNQQPSPITDHYFCVGTHRYSFVKGAQYTPGTNYGIIKETVPCVDPATGGSATPDIHTGD